MTQTQILANRGSDVEFTFNWKTTSNTNADLTGWSIAAMDVSTAISSYLTTTITTANVGLITTRLVWDDAFETGVSYTFRLQVTSGANSEATNLIEVVYQ
jgi:hypothetical protein